MINNASYTKPTVLIIDDEEVHQQRLAETFYMLGFETLAVKRNKEGVNLFNSFKDTIDLVFVNNLLPEMNGNSTIKKLKKIDPNIKILCMSNHKHEIEKRLQSMADVGFIDRPATVDQLIKGLNDVIK